MEFVHAVGDSVRQRIFLRVDRACCDCCDCLGQIEPYGDRAQKREGLLLHFAWQHTDAQSAQIRRRMDRTCPVRDMAEAVLEEAEDAIADAVLDGASQRASKLAVDCGPCRTCALE